MGQLNGYLEALLPETIEVLSLRMRPFCLAHLNLMQRDGSTFLSGFEGAPQAILKYTHDFMVAVFICSMTWEEGQEAFNNDTITIREKVQLKDKSYKEVYRKTSFTGYVAKWNTLVEKGCKNGSINILQEMKKMQDYISKAFAGPDAYEIKSAGRKTNSGAPWEQSLRDFLLDKYTESEGMNLPLALGFWEWTREGEKNQEVGIKSDEDYEAIALLKGMEASK